MDEPLPRRLRCALRRPPHGMGNGPSAAVAAAALAALQLAASPVVAGPGPATPPVAAASAASPASATATPGARPAARVQVIEDDQVRIEETRVRGQLQRVTVAPKGSAMKPYEINVGAGGRDPSQDKSAAGQRVWSVLRF